MPGAASDAEAKAAAKRIVENNLVKCSWYGGDPYWGRLLAAAGSAHPERDAWTLIAWVEGTAFYALAGAGGAAAPARDVLQAQLATLLATMIPAAR